MLAMVLLPFDVYAGARRLRAEARLKSGTGRIASSTGRIFGRRSSVLRLAVGIARLSVARRSRGRRRRAPGLRAADGQMAHDAVGDLEDARDLVQRIGLCRERQQVVRAVRLVVDLVGELAPAPDFVLLEAPAAAFEELARARHDFLLALIRGLRIQHEQNLVVDHVPSCLPSVWSGLTGGGRPGTGRRLARQVAGDTIA